MSLPVVPGGREGRISQGDVFWFDGEVPTGSGPGYRRPHVVVQNNSLNHGGIGTVVVCELTTNLRLARAPGNVVLDEGEANLPRRSVVNVTQVVTVDKDELVEQIGRLQPSRVRQIVDGLRFVFEPRERV